MKKKYKPFEFELIRMYGCQIVTLSVNDNILTEDPDSDGYEFDFEEM